MEYTQNWFSNMLEMDEPYCENGMVFLTSENYYQAMKFPDVETQMEISKMNPYKAKRYANKNKEKWVTDWDKKKVSVMYHILKWKFKKGTSWYDKLMECEDQIIVEWNNWNDLYWGKDIVTKEGKNTLGILLTTLRNEYILSELF